MFQESAVRHIIPLFSHKLPCLTLHNPVRLHQRSGFKSQTGISAPFLSMQNVFLTVLGACPFGSGYRAVSFWAQDSSPVPFILRRAPRKDTRAYPSRASPRFQCRQSGDRSRSARQECLRAGNQAYRTVHDTTYGLKHQPHSPVNILRGATSDRIKF